MGPSGGINGTRWPTRTSAPSRRGRPEAPTITISSPTTTLATHSVSQSAARRRISSMAISMT